MTSFNDIFKSSFLTQTSTFSLVDMALAMLVAFAVGMLIFFVYRRTYTGVLYSASFGVSLLALTLITTLVLLAVTSNVVLSLGMVGALSIVRFRTAIKEPLDIAFLFWAIAVGIVCGAGLFMLAICGSIIIAVMLLVFTSRKSVDTPYIVILTCADDAAERDATAMVRAKVRKSLLKSKSITAQGIELTMEVRLQEATAQFVNELSALPGVEQAVLVSYNGEYMA